ncbi:MAG: hypothetical protein ACLRS7_12165 [Acutalibacter sp.]
MKNVYQHANCFDDVVLYSTFFCEELGTEDPNSTLALYHYTNWEVYTSFIRKFHGELEIRLTNITAFDDKKEGYHVFPVLYGIFLEAYKDQLIDRDFCCQLLQELCDCNKQKNQLRKWYVLSLSDESDCPYLKENYACKNRKPGAIIGLHTLALTDLRFLNENAFLISQNEQPKRDTPNIFLRRVIYDKSVFKEFVYNSLKSAYKFRHQIACSHYSPHHLVRNFVDVYRLYCKDSNYKEEKEVRLIVDGNVVKEYPASFSFETRCSKLRSRYSDKCQHNDVCREHLYLYLPESALYHVEHLSISPASTSTSSADN